MKIPKQIQVGPFIYKVKVSKMELRNSDGYQLYGQSRHYEKDILIDYNPGLTSQEETFIHEVVHCLDAVYKFSDKDLPEGVIERLGTSLYAFIKDNERVFK